MRLCTIVCGRQSSADKHALHTAHRATKQRSIVRYSACFQAFTRSVSHSANRSIPSPVLAQTGITFADGLRMAMYSRHLSMSKSKYGATSILLISTTLHTWKINGYYSGLSCPSGTDNIIAFTTAPVSNSAGQTKLPTFSNTTKSKSSTPNSRKPCLVMSASR